MTLCFELVNFLLFEFLGTGLDTIAKIVCCLDISSNNGIDSSADPKKIIFIKFNNIF